MTDYERLAADLNAAGIKATRESAYRLAQREWTGQAMTDGEALVVDAWKLAMAAEPWGNATARQRGVS